MTMMFVSRCCLLIFFSGCALLRQPDLNVISRRTQVIDAYLDEFCSAALREGVFGQAIHDVLMRIPADALKIVLNRRRPVIFTEVYDSGTARFASSQEVIVTPKDIPAFQGGMTIIKISLGLGAGSQQAMEGIIAHELAHRILDHIRRGHVSCQAEREANRLIKSWGFTKEFTAASTSFGQKVQGGGSASCQEKPDDHKG